MPDYSLKKISVLEEYNNEINGIKISEIENVAIYALAIKEKNEEKAALSLKNSFDAIMPYVGASSISKKYNLKILRFSVDQLFLFFDSKILTTIQYIFKIINDSFYITEQTDAWCGLRVSGANIKECLIRICAIDISIEQFPVNAFAKTIMEHLGTIIIRSQPLEFELFSASSSAQSFLHAVETSARNI